MTVLEAATDIMMNHDKTAFRCPDRTRIFACKLNEKLGFPESTDRIKYVDAVPSLNTILPRHFDSKDDHRPGYTRSAVYSFITNMNNRNYHLAIVMCTCSSVGACLEQLSKNN